MASPREEHRDYGHALRSFLDEPAEERLEEAYELGREALASGRGILEVVETHRLALSRLRAEEGDPVRLRELEDRAAAFLAESLAPFEIAERGYREANATLTRLNAELARRAEELAAANDAIRGAEERASFLARAGHELTSSLELEDTLETLVALPVGPLADGCAIELTGDPAVHPLAVAVAREGAAPEVRRATHPGSVEHELCLLALAEGRPDRGPLPPCLVSMLRLPDGTPGAWLAMPLLARGRRLGTLAFVALGSARRAGVSDVRLADDFAFRAALAVDNALLYREAKQAVRARDDFLAVACHELRTPLTPLATRISTGDRQLKRGDRLDPDFLETAQRQVRQLARITKQMLDAALIQAGDLPLRQERVDLAAVVHEALAAFVPGPRHRLNVEIAGPTPVHVDVGLIGEVLQGLLENAVKFSPDGGTVGVVVSARESRAILAVSDTGIGIPGQQLEAVFHGFFRASNAPVLSRGGLGLGLYVTRAIVERHGGRVRVESVEGRGTTFYVELPLAG